MDLPKRLQNLGIQPAPKENEKVIAKISTVKVQALADIFDRPSKDNKEANI